MLGDPFSFRPSRSEYDRLRREMNRLFEQSWRPNLHTASAYPAMNVWTNAEGALVTAEVPGIDLESLDISVRENMLTVKGSRELHQLEEGERYHRRERGGGEFNRTFQLPYNVETGGVEAAYDKGVLRIWLPRAEADKPRKITVRSVE